MSGDRGDTSRPVLGAVPPLPPALDDLDALERRAVSLLGQARPMRPVAQEIVARTRVRVLAAATGARPVPRRRVYVITTLGCLLGAFGGAALAAHYLKAPAQVVEEAAAAKPRARRARPVGELARAVPPAVTPRLEELVEDDAAVGAPSMQPRPRRVRPVAPAPATLLARESNALASALRALEQDDDPGAALRRLDAYEERFPAGQLAAEAKLARAQALMKAGRAADALSFLERVALDKVSRSGELLVLRGELRAARGRCEDALVDFDRSLAREPNGPRAERALFGRASCRGSLGDLAGARTDLEAYAHRFPAGRFSTQTRRALERAR